MCAHRQTVLAFGTTGHGKSEFLNAYLQKQVFAVSDDPKSCTCLTSSSDNVVSLDLRTGIDTQGIDDSEGMDEPHVQQMVNFLKAWPHGVNAFALVINGQAPRFDQGTQKLVKLLDSFFNDPTFWSHVGIVFTKWFPGMSSGKKEVMRTEYRQKVLQLVRQLIGNEEQDPQLPVFFVNSPKWETDADTQREIGEFHQFARSLNPLPTTSVSCVNIHFWRVTLETQNQILTETRYDGNTRIQVYEDQQRERRIAYDGQTITYGDWTSTRQWEVQSSSSVQTERTTTVIDRKSTPVCHIEECGPRRFGFCGPRDGRRQVVDYYVETCTWQTNEREIKTDFDGQVTYGNWRVVNTWTQ
jgi:hypothetical protein